MLTQKIEKYKPVYQQTHHHYQVGSFHQRSNLTVPNVMGKMEFAIYLRDLKIKKGDWVTYNTRNIQLSNYNVYKVLDFDEIHYLIKSWGTPESGPIVMTLGGYRENRENGHVVPERAVPWKAGPGLYMKVDHDKVPETPKKLYADTNDFPLLCSC